LRHVDLPDRGRAGRQEGSAADRADADAPALRVGLITGDDRSGRAEIARAAEGAGAAAAEDDDGVAAAQRDAALSGSDLPGG